MRALQTPDDFIAAGLLAPADGPVAARVAGDFRLLLSPAMGGAIHAPDDPVARQFVPSAAELLPDPAGRPDPIGDGAHRVAPGLTHRYPDRAILQVTQTCAVYCRFCFRREAVGDTGALPPRDLQAALDHLARTPAIREVILTGGDPLTLSPRRLAAIRAALAAMPHVELMRIHSRIPVVAPERITAPLLDALGGPGPTVWLVIHTNHAQELTAPARAAIARLADRGIPLLSQSVLLRGVNDRADALEDLFRALLKLRVKPYYLHHCDLARGAGHFRTGIAAGQGLMAELRRRLSGTGLPAFVLDIPGGYGKVPVAAPHVVPGDGPGLWRVTDREGRVHAYADPDRGQGASGAISSTSSPPRIAV